MPPTIVTVDGSEYADVALPLALDLARLIGTSLDLMTRYLTRIITKI